MAGKQAPSLATKVSTDAVSYTCQQNCDRQTLKQLDDHLRKADIESLKFLLSDVIPSSDMETIKRGIRLFEELETRGKLKQNDCGLLAESLYRIGRVDLVKKIPGVSLEGVKMQAQNSGMAYISAFRILLHDLCQNMTKKDLGSAKYLSELSKAMQEKLTTSQLYLQELENSGTIGPDNLGHLVDVFKELENEECLQKVLRFQASRLSTTQAASGKMSDEKPAVYHEYYRGQPFCKEKPVGKTKSGPKFNAVQEIRRGVGVSRGHHENQESIENTVSSSTCRTQSGQPVMQPATTHIQPETNAALTTAKPGLTVATSQPQNKESASSESQPNQGPAASGPLASQLEKLHFRDRPDNLSGDQVTPQPVVSPPGWPILNYQQGFYADPQLLQNIFMAYPQHVHPQVAQGIQMMYSGATPMSPINPGIGNVCPDDMPSYKMTTNPRGVCLVINNEEFSYDPNANPSAKQLKNRAGSMKDLEKFVKIFQDLKFAVYAYKDLTAQEIWILLNEIGRRVDHTNLDSFVCCIMSHGKLNAVYGADGLEISVPQIIDHFKGTNCPSLVDKPKIFFLQACQGKDKQKAAPKVQKDSPEPDSPEPDSPGDDDDLLPNEADFLIGYSTVQGYASFRHEEEGTWYINKLCAELQSNIERQNKLHLLDILTRVNDEVSKLCYLGTDGTYKQMPSPYFTLRKRLYLLP